MLTVVILHIMLCRSAKQKKHRAHSYTVIDPLCSRLRLAPQVATLGRLRNVSALHLRPQRPEAGRGRGGGGGGGGCENELHDKKGHFLFEAIVFNTFIQHIMYVCWKKSS